MNKDYRQEVYVVAAQRSPVGKIRGAFAQMRPDDLLARVLRGTLDQLPTFDPALIDDVIVGCAMPEGEQGMNVARVALLMADFPYQVPGVTVNRFCSSGLQTIAMAHDRISIGESDVIVAAGVESMSRVPMGGFNYRGNLAWYAEEERHVDISFSMGITAEKVAKQWDITREQQDNFSFTSHQRALTAIAAGEFKNEILPITVTSSTPDLSTGDIIERQKIIDTDEGPRKNTSLEMLARLKPVFAAKGTVTAGSSSQMSDGAGAVVLMSESMVKRLSINPLAKLHAFTVVGVPPKIMGIGPSYAIPKALKKAGLSLDQIDWIELNEAFAAQALAVIKEAGLDPAKVNPLGGAIALGHPLGATGAIRAATLVHGLQRHQKKYGMVSMCIGTGMGAAGIFERL